MKEKYSTKPFVIIEKIRVGSLFSFCCVEGEHFNIQPFFARVYRLNGTFRPGGSMCTVWAETASVQWFAGSVLAGGAFCTAFTREGGAELKCRSVFFWNRVVSFCWRFF